MECYNCKAKEHCIAAGQPGSVICMMNILKYGVNGMECYNCKAKEHCIAAAQPGSVICMMNILKYDGTHADDAPPRQAGNFCQNV